VCVGGHDEEREAHEALQGPHGQGQGNQRAIGNPATLQGNGERRRRRVELPMLPDGYMTSAS
jgi:hypothetical protein